MYSNRRDGGYKEQQGGASGGLPQDRRTNSPWIKNLPIEDDETNEQTIRGMPNEIDGEDSGVSKRIANEIWNEATMMTSM